MNVVVLFVWISKAWDKILFYGSLLGLFLVFQWVREDLHSFSQMVDKDTQFLSRAPHASSLIDEARVANLVDRVTNAAAFAHAPARDLFCVVPSRVAPSVVPQPVQVPLPQEGKGRFSLIKIYRQPVRLLFKGYLQLPDGSYSLQINWAGQTDFKQMGESIRGYRIEKFQKILDTAPSGQGYLREVDRSVVIIRKEPDGAVQLEKGKLISEKELFAKLFDSETSQGIAVHVGTTLGSYKVLDITEDEVILSDPEGKQISLKHSR